MSFPAIEQIDRIAAMADPAARNLEITHCYHLLSQSFAQTIPGGANWCTFAAWASRQAGQTIRREDLMAALRRHPLLAKPLADFSRATGIGPAQTAPVVDAVLREIEPFRVSSEAVGRGNKKVFEEIAREFSRFLRDFSDKPERDDAAIEDFVAVLNSGPPPNGQDELKRAFRNYNKARFTTSPKECAELLLLANLQIGFHEQTRLQPEIKESLDAAAGEPERLSEGIFGRLMPRENRFLPHASGFGLACHLLAEKIREIARMVVTQKLMTLEIGGETLRLGQDLSAAFPPNLAHLTNPELVTLLQIVDPTPDSTLESRAIDWANFVERIHYIADLFRTHQERPTLLLEPSEA